MALMIKSYVYATRICACYGSYIDVIGIFWGDRSNSTNYGDECPTTSAALRCLSPAEYFIGLLHFTASDGSQSSPRCMRSVRWTASACAARVMFGFERERVIAPRRE